MKKEDIIEKIDEFLIDEFEVEPDDITPEADLKAFLRYTKAIISLDKR